MKKLIVAVLALMLLTLPFACFAEEEEYPCFDFEMDAYCYAGGMLQFFFNDGSMEETGGWSFSADYEEGLTVADMMADFEVAEVVAVCEDDVFEGWLVFDVEVTEDEDGFSEYNYVLTSETPISTEEVLAYSAVDGYVVFAAKWESIPAEDYYSDDSEEYDTIRIAAVTLYANDGAILVHSEEEDYEISMDVGTFEPGQKVSEVLELDSILSVTREGFEFDGWTVYEVGYMETIEGMPEETEDAFFFEVFDGWYCVVSDYTVLNENVPTEEMAEIVCGETDLLIVAEWK